MSISGHAAQSAAAAHFTRRAANAPSTPLCTCGSVCMQPSGVITDAGAPRASAASTVSGCSSQPACRCRKLATCPQFSSCSSEHVEYTSTPPGSTTAAAASSSCACVYCVHFVLGCHRPQTSQPATSLPTCSCCCCVAMQTLNTPPHTHTRKPAAAAAAPATRAYVASAGLRAYSAPRFRSRARPAAPGSTSCPQPPVKRHMGHEHLCVSWNPIQ